MTADPNRPMPGAPQPAGMLFAAAAHWTSLRCGRASTFAIAVGAILAWAISGPFFHFSDTWQLVINTGTTVVTFLMVFLIQNTQNRDSAVLHLKLDELIRVNENARNRLLDLEGLSEEELERLKAAFGRLANMPPDESLLRDAVEDLEGAGRHIRDATTRIEAATSP